MPTSSPWVVLKFGGTSVSTRERWETIAAVARQRRADGERPFIVCSALSGISNLLEKLTSDAGRGAHEPVLDEIERRHVALGETLGLDAQALLGTYFDELRRIALGVSLVGEAGPSLRARVMATGELMSTTLGAAFFNAQGLPTHWADARRLLRAAEAPNVVEAMQYLSAACESEPDAALQTAMDAVDEDVVLTQGFIAGNEEGETVLLGRGGSDTSAAYFAARLQARRLEIWTDVPGLFTANPHQVPSARLLRRLGYDEAQELATTGAKVLHPRCIEPVQRFGIPLHIRCTQAPDLEGTILTDDVPDFGAHVKAVSAKTSITLISMDSLGMWQQVGFLARVFDLFARHGLSIDLVTTSATNVTVSLDPAANALDPSSIRSLMRQLDTFCQAREVSPCAVVSLVGHNIRSVLHEMSAAMETLDEQRVLLISQSASDVNFTFAVDEKHADRLVRRLHAQLFDRQQTDDLFGPTWEEIFEPTGTPQVHTYRTWWQQRRGDLLALADEHLTPLYVYDEDTLSTSAGALQAIDAVDRVFYSIKANTNPEVLRRFYDAGFGFECISPGEVRYVLSLFPDIDRDRILFTLNYAPRVEYEYGFAEGVHMVLDSIYALETWPEVFRGRDLIVRIDPGRGHGHHKYVRTAGPQSKFGVAPGLVGRLRTLTDDLGARVVGFHAHVGSGIKTPQTWSQTAVFLAALAADFPDVRILNLGGGLGVPERPAVPGLDLDVVADSLRTFKKADPRFELWMEPGRYLVAHAGVLLTRVTQVKHKDRLTYVGVETGMNSFIRPVLYGAYHEIVNLSKLDHPIAMTAEICGPICESADILGHARRLPETAEGDVLLIATAGAYGHTMHSHYNLREPAKEVFLEGRGV